MNWDAATVWWLATGALVALELATGTFYLLMLALGCAAGALAAHAGLGLTAQVVTAALLGGGATVAWHLRRRRSPVAAVAERNRDVNLDIGGTVMVPAWAADGTARVQYRGASWTVRTTESAPPAPGPHVIVAVRGSELQVTPAPTH